MALGDRFDLIIGSDGLQRVQGVEWESGVYHAITNDGGRTWIHYGWNRGQTIDEFRQQFTDHYGTCDICSRAYVLGGNDHNPETGNHVRCEVDKEITFKRYAPGLYVDSTNTWVISRDREGTGSYRPLFTIRRLIDIGPTLSGDPFPDYDHVVMGEYTSLIDAKNGVRRNLIDYPGRGPIGRH